MSASTDQYDAIVIGAGVVGPAVATGLARQGRKILLIERDWTKPDRIVGELMQPSGLKALKSLGMIGAVNDIDAIPVEGYGIFYKDEVLKIDYPFKSSSINKHFPDVSCCVTNTNNKIHDDNTLSLKRFEESERELGVAFRHGEFIGNLRKIAKGEPNITCLKGSVCSIESNQDDGKVIGVKVKQDDSDEQVFYKAHLTVCCDGIFSKFRKFLSEDNVPRVGSHFVSLTLEDADIPIPNHGHVVIKPGICPILVYQISPKETRILCAYPSKTTPSLNQPEFKKYIYETVLKSLPPKLQPSYKKALSDSRVRIMPNSYLVAKRNQIEGLLVLGDALNMRHPLTGGGMTVGLNDAALVCRMLSCENIPDFANTSMILDTLLDFHMERKALDTVINVLSIALYSLFGADSRSLEILQYGCFRYLQKEPSPIQLLSGLLPEPFTLFRHFFTVAFYAIGLNFKENGIAKIHISIYEAILTLYTAIVVFLPYLWGEFFS